MGRTRAEWIAEMDLEDDEDDYEARKVAMLMRIRTKWPKREDLKSYSVTQQQELKEWIRQWVKRYNIGDKMKLWTEEQRLAFYTSWAFAINSQSREEKRVKNYQGVQAEKENEIEMTDRPALNDGTEPHETDIQESIEVVHQQNAEQPQSTLPRPNARTLALTSQAINNFTTPKVYSVQSTGSSKDTTIDWDAIEVAVDATVVGLGIVWLPMITLKPDASERCHWKNFDIKKLREHIERDTEKIVDMSIHNLVYNEYVHSQVVIGAQGSYSIALKRFVELGEGRGRVLQLSVQPKDGLLVAGDGQRGKNYGGTLAMRQTRAVKSRFDGGSSDFSIEE